MWFSAKSIFGQIGEPTGPKMSHTFFCENSFFLFFMGDGAKAAPLSTKMSVCLTRKSQKWQRLKFELFFWAIFSGNFQDKLVEKFVQQKQDKKESNFKTYSAKESYSFGILTFRKSQVTHQDD